MREYHLFHDVGKSFCRTVDAEGRQHFPDHARISAAIWSASGGSAEVRDLIARDMDFHTMKPADIPQYGRMDLAPALLLTALCELHSNCRMFGGTDSTSFRIKFKNLTRLGRAVLNRLKETP